MKLLHGIAALAFVLLFSTLALADTIPTDPHMIPAVCPVNTVCVDIPVTGNTIPAVMTDANGNLPGTTMLFQNANTGIGGTSLITWTTFEIVIHAVIPFSATNNFNDPALLPAGFFQAFGTPTVTVANGETFLNYPALPAPTLFSIGPGDTLGYFGFGLPANTQVDGFANVPEPATFALLLTGIAGVVARRRLRKHRIDHS